MYHPDAERAARPVLRLARSARRRGPSGLRARSYAGMVRALAVTPFARHIFASALGLLALFAARPAQAQEAFQQWFSLPFTYDVGQAELRPQLWTDLHARRRAGSTLVIVRPAVGVRFNRVVTAHAGYAWIPTLQDQAAAADTHEHRAFQQLILNLPPLWWMAWQLRTRLEQRLSPLGDDVGLRLRQFARVGFRFAEGSPWQLVLWDELFVGFNDLDWGPRAGFDQNRLFVGPGVDVPALGGRFELGYLWNALRGAPTPHAHVLFTQLVVAL